MTELEVKIIDDAVTEAECTAAAIRGEYAAAGFDRV